MCLGELANCLHEPPQIGTIVPNAYSAIASTLLELQTPNQFLISRGRNGFYNDDVTLYNGAIGGMFSMKNENQQYSLIYRSTKMKSFNILIAVLKQGYWQLIFRLVSGENRLFCLEIEPGQYLRSGTTVPTKFANNTSLVMCVKCDFDWKIDMNIKLFGIEYGSIS